jgi:hypothetical protein
MVPVVERRSHATDNLVSLCSALALTDPDPWV